MSFEADLNTLLRVRCPRVFPDVAPVDTARPYITWQLIGGRPLRWLDNTAADKRQVLVQINVWADTRAATLTLARQIEDDMCASAAFVATPQNEVTAVVEEEFDRYGCIQDFLVYATR